MAALPSIWSLNSLILLNNLISHFESKLIVIKLMKEKFFLYKMSSPEMLQKPIVSKDPFREVFYYLFSLSCQILVKYFLTDGLAKTEFIIIFWFYLNDLKVYATRFNTFVQLLTANEENCWLISRDMLVAAKFTF